MLRSRPLRNLREMLHESIAVSTLNKEILSSGRAAFTPITDILKLLQQLERIRIYDSTSQSSERKAQSIIRLVNGKLSRYSWPPGIAGSSDDKFYELPQFPRGKQIEQAALWLLLGKLQSGGLLRFRRCSNCSLWFSAKRNGQRFCKDSCRKMHASKSSEYKKKRRIYMRQYRQEQKKIDAAATVLAARVK